MNGRKSSRLIKNNNFNTLNLGSAVIVPQISAIPQSSIIIDIKKQKSYRIEKDILENTGNEEKRESEYLIRIKEGLVQMPHSVNDVDIKLTFIIPTIDRSTLPQTIKSLQYQTSKNWYAIIIFDGIEPSFHCKDPRITFLTCDKLGEGSNHAGKVRNHGMTFVKTDWIAFLDDDDSISSKYVETFYEEIKNYKTDVIIFRMYFNYDIFPELKTDDFYKGKIGISFVIKKDIINEGFTFSPSKYEDYEYLSLLKSKNYTIMISPYVLYFVREYNVDSIVNGNRVFINEKNANSMHILEEKPVKKEEYIDPTFTTDARKKIKNKTIEYRSAYYYYHKKYKKIRIEHELSVLNIVSD